MFFMFFGLYLTDNINGIDNYFSNLIISLRSADFTKFFIFITFLAGTKFVIIMMLLFVIIYIIRKKNIFLIFNMIITGEVILNNVIKILIGRERPSILHLVVETSYSFPSGHAMVSVVMYGFLIYLINKTNINKYLKLFLDGLLIVLIFLIMMSRIYLGAHYFSDVIAGASLATSYLLLLIDILERRNVL